MLALNSDGCYVLTIGNHAGETLSWHLKHRRYYLHTTLCCMANSPDDVDIVTAALAVYATDMDPDKPGFWAAVDAIMDEKREAEDIESREYYDKSVPKPR